ADPIGDAALAAELRRAHAPRVVYLSSTGGYPPGDGGWVDEDTAPAPTSDHGRRRREAAQTLVAGLAPLAVALRAAAIYGPGRGVHARLRAGSYRVLGPGTGWVSRIQVDDLVAAILAAASIATLPASIINVADARPTTAR